MSRMRGSERVAAAEGSGPSEAAVSIIPAPEAARVGGRQAPGDRDGVPQVATILNIGCGTKTSNDSRVVNLDWSIYLFIKTHPLLLRLSRFMLSDERLARLSKLPDSIAVHDLRKGIPYPDSSVDAVYHSHFLEHLDRPIARRFLREVARVLKPGGVHRIVVPDLERLCADYLTHLQACLADPTRSRDHDGYVAAMIEQMVRREAFATQAQTPLRRFIERLLVGDARGRGETHQWMYDRVSLGQLLNDEGYRDVRVERFDTSRIPDWNRFGLDRDDYGHEYKTESLYVEAVKSDRGRAPAAWARI